MGLIGDGSEVASRCWGSAWRVGEPRLHASSDPCAPCSLLDAKATGRGLLPLPNLDRVDPISLSVLTPQGVKTDLRLELGAVGLPLSFLAHLRCPRLARHSLSYCPRIGVHYRWRLAFRVLTVEQNVGHFEGLALSCRLNSVRKSKLIVERVPLEDIQTTI